MEWLMHQVKDDEDHIEEDQQLSPGNSSAPLLLFDEELAPVSTSERAAPLSEMGSQVQFVQNVGSTEVLPGFIQPLVNSGDPEEIGEYDADC